MAEVLRFFPRQTLVGAAAGSEYYSEIFEVAEYSHITFQLRVYLLSAGANVQAELETTSDPTLTDGWEVLVIAPTPLVVATGSQDVARTTEAPARFVRAKVTLPEEVCQATLMCEGVARGGV
jgi:hypothetical protein